MKISPIVWLLLAAGVAYYLWSSANNQTVASQIALANAQESEDEADAQQQAVINAQPQSYNALLGALTVPLGNAISGAIGSLNNAFSSTAVSPGSSVYDSSLTTSNYDTPVYNNDGSILGDISDN